MKPTIFDYSGRVDTQEVVRALGEDGVAILRGLVPAQSLAAIDNRIKEHMEQPELAGVQGYWKADHPKVIQKATTVGGPLMPLLVDPRVTEIVEAVFGAPCVLGEATVKIDQPTSYAYFPMHRDFMVGWKKSADSTKTLKLDDLEKMPGINCVYYLHDTRDGALQYVMGSHKNEYFEIGRYSALPAKKRTALQENTVLCAGLAGDMVIFNSLGFHGPAQPSRSPRTAILLEYYNTLIFGHTQVSPMPLWSCDLAGLSPKQMFILGAGAEHMVSAKDYTYTRFKRSKLYRLANFVVRNGFLIDHFKNNLKSHLLRRPAA